MKTTLTMFCLTALSLLSSCDLSEAKKEKDAANSFDQQMAEIYNNCVVEVPCIEVGIYSAGCNWHSAHKFYNFCDSSVIIAGYSGEHGGPIFSKRSITDVKGTERTEMLRAYQVYQDKLKNQ